MPFDGTPTEPPAECICHTCPQAAQHRSAEASHTAHIRDLIADLAEMKDRLALCIAQIAK
jgi:hypothetical protein